MTSVHTKKDAHAPRILLVEDVAFNREIIALILDGQGWMITNAESGEAALAILNEDCDFQVILMDLGLPGMDGFAAARQIKDKPATSAIPIIALSAEPFPGIHTLEQAAFAGFIEKNFVPEEMITAIGRYLLRGTPLLDHASPRACLNPPLYLNLPALRARYPEEKQLQRITEAFFRDANQEMGKLAMAKMSGDLAGVRAACHGLSGAAAIFTADHLGQSATTLAALVKNGDLAGADAAWRELIASLAELRLMTARETGYHAPPFSG